MPRSRFGLALLLLLLITSTVFAAGRELAPQQLGESPYRESFPAIASNGGRFLTLWREERRDFGVQIMGSLSDTSGQRVSPESFVVVPNANPTWMQLVPTGNGYTLFWYHSPEVTNMVDLDANGRVLASRRLDVPYHIRRDIAWNGTHFLMAFKHSAGISNKAEALLFRRDGQIVRSGIPIDDDLFAVEAIVSGGSFFVLTTSYTGMTAYRITDDGVVSEQLLEARRANSPYMPIHPLAVDRGDGSVLLAWSAGDTARSELLTAVIAPGRDMTEPRLILARNAAQRVLIPLLLSRGTDRYVLTFAEVGSTGFIEYSLSALTLDASGTVLEDPTERVPIGIWSATAASNGSVTVVAYTPQLGLDQRLEQRIVDARARISQPEVHSIARSRHLQPILSAGGGRYLAAFEERSDKSTIHVSSIDSLGTPQVHRAVGEGQVPRSDLVWNGSEYFFAFFQDSAVRALRLDVVGRAIDPTPLYIGGANAGTRNIAVAWNGERWTVVWNDHYGAQLASVSAGGVVRQHGDLRLDAPRPANTHRTLWDVAIAVDESRLLVAWTENYIEQCLMPICQSSLQNAWLRRFQLEGAPSTRVIPIETDVIGVTMTASGDEYVLLTDTHAGTKALVIDDDYGMTFLATATFPAGLSDVTWDGEEFVMAQRYRRIWPNHLVITRFDRELNETAPPRGIETLKSDERARPSIASAMHGDALVAIAEGDAVNGSRAVVYSERDMPLLPGPPQRRRAVR